MVASTALETLNVVQRLIEMGRYAVVFERLSMLPPTELESSPTLSLLMGIAQSRLGSLRVGRDWVHKALERARRRGDSPVQARALNVLGAIAFQLGQIDEASEYFIRALAEAERLGDLMNVARCSNNLGAIATLRGEYGKAVGSYTMALAAFQQTRNRNGLAETLHNMAIAYREQNDFVTARETEERAAYEAAVANDAAMLAAIESGRAEVQLFDGDADLAVISARRAVSMHRELGDVAGELEGLRILALSLHRSGEELEGKKMLRDVLARAATLDRPLLAAQTERDFARLLHEEHADAEARDMARRARSRFEQMGSEGEVRRLDEFLNAVAV